MIFESTLGQFLLWSTLWPLTFGLLGSAGFIRVDLMVLGRLGMVPNGGDPLARDALKRLVA